MSKKATISGELAKKLGGLFYVIANSDGRIMDEERQQLVKLIDNRWSAYETSITEGILQQFNKASDEELSIEVCFSNFESYALQHRDAFSKSLVNLIMKTSSAIAYSFAKINKSELHYLMRLNILFKKLDL